MIERMTLERLAEIEAREGAATPGPWEARPKILDARGEIDCEIVGGVGPGYSTPVCKLSPGFYRYEGDKTFITHARQDIPDLVAEIRRLLELNEQLSQGLQALATINNAANQEAAKLQAIIAGLTHEVAHAYDVGLPGLPPRDVDPALYEDMGL